MGFGRTQSHFGYLFLTAASALTLSSCKNSKSTSQSDSAVGNASAALIEKGSSDNSAQESAQSSPVASQQVQASVASSQQQQLNANNYEFQLGPARLVASPEVVKKYHLGDSNFFTIKHNGRIFGYTGNQTTWVYEGTHIHNMRFTRRKAISGGAYPRFDHCGAWLYSALKLAGRIVGFYHAERGCNYERNGQSYGSIAYSVSNNGIEYHKVGYPNNQVLTGHSPFEEDAFRGAGMGTVVKMDDYLYMYFTELQPAPAGWTIGVARSPISSQGTPGSWRKLYNGKFNSPARGGYSQNLRWNAQLNRRDADKAPGGSATKSLLTNEVFLVGPRPRGVLLSHASDGIDFQKLQAPLLPSTEQDWRRTRPVWQNYNPVTRSHTMSLSGNGVPLVYAVTQYRTGLLKIVNCKDREGKVAMRRACRPNEAEMETIGWAWPQPTAETKVHLRPPIDAIPLYLCYAPGVKSYYVGRVPGCGNSRLQRHGLIAYFRTQPAGALFSYTSLVANEGGVELGKHFHLFYSLIRPGEPLADRRIVRHPVRMVKRSNYSLPNASVQLSRYVSQDRRKFWTTTTLPTPEFDRNNPVNLGRVYTAPFKNSVRLIDCKTKVKGTHILRASNICGPNELKLRTLGFISRISRPEEGFSPLYRCHVPSNGSFVVSKQPNCGSSSHRAVVRLGYIKN